MTIKTIIIALILITSSSPSPSQSASVSSSPGVWPLSSIPPHTYIHHRRGHRPNGVLTSSKINYTSLIQLSRSSFGGHHRRDQHYYYSNLINAQQPPFGAVNVDLANQAGTASIDDQIANASLNLSTIGQHNPNNATNGSNFILHSDEDILQWIHQVSRGKRCVQAVLTQIPPAPVVPVPISSSVANLASNSNSLTLALESSSLLKSSSSSLAAEASAASDVVNNVIKSLLLTPGQETTALNSLHSHIPILVTSERQAQIRQAFTDNQRGKRVQKCVDLLAKVLGGYNASSDSYGLLLKSIETVPIVEIDIHRLWIAWTIRTVRKRQNENNSNNELSGSRPRPEKGTKVETQAELAWFHCSRGGSKENETICLPGKNQGERNLLNATNTWLPENLTQKIMDGEIYVTDAEMGTPADPLIEWSDVFFDCLDKRWYVSYNVLIVEPSPKGESNDTDSNEKGIWYTVKGVIRADVDVSKTDINQCDQHSSEDDEDGPLFLTLVTSSSEKRALEEQAAGQENAEPVYQRYQLHHPKHRRQHLAANASDIAVNLFGTHKCHNENSICEFESGHGMARGGYSCKCKDGYHSAVSHLGPVFRGVNMEDSFHDKLLGKNPSYDYMYYCKRCAPGCDVCVDESPCLSTYNWAFRISLLTITVFCIIFVFIIAFHIYRHRKLKVIKVASPVFLCLTLLGCVIMYLEAVAIFPVLDVFTCVLTKWTRNFGFCITYSALLLKTWRVSLTYRVKSAHKIKLTDKQLLQWLFPILLVMAIYLGAWTISDTPQAVYIIDWNNMKFKQCDYNWWDHSLAIGEFAFLLWGIKVCYNVRNAESLFNEAKYIVWAIYNITLVNIIMILIHVFILPNSGPDIKYFFGFVRTQLSTTVTVILIFGPKFYRVIKGQGDLWDNQLRARGLAATFSFNGVGLAHEETTDLYQENEELKEEIQKLASQLEIMKICQMEFKNRHLGKSKDAKQ